MGGNDNLISIPIFALSLPLGAEKTERRKMSQATVPERKSSLPPAAIVFAGCLIALLSFGPRSVMGAFQLPVFSTRAWGAESFSIALATQNLLWGVGQPFAGALADRFGSNMC